MATRKKKTEGKKAPLPSDFDGLVKQVTAAYGKNLLVKAGDVKGLSRVQRVRTGILAYDIAHGGGIACGRIHTILGEYSSGKTALSLKIAAAFQRHCRNCGHPMFSWDELRMRKEPLDCCNKQEPCVVVWVDLEKVWDSKWAARLGVNVDDVYIMRPAYAEQMVDVADLAIRSGQADLLVIDSIAAVTPTVEIEKSVEDQQMAEAARLLSKACRKWTSGQTSVSLGDGRSCTIIAINQIRMKVGLVFGDPRTASGGKAINEYYNSTKTEVKRTDIVEADNGLCIGIEMEAALKKNKTAPPFRTAKFDLAFREFDGRAAGSSNIAEQLIHLAKFWKLIRVEGAWFSLAKGVRLQGYAASAAYLRSPAGAKLFAMLHDKVWEREVGWLEGTGGT